MHKYNAKKDYFRQNHSSYNINKSQSHNKKQIEEQQQQHISEEEIIKETPGAPTSTSTSASTSTSRMQITKTTHSIYEYTVFEDNNKKTRYVEEYIHHVCLYIYSLQT